MTYVAAEPEVKTVYLDQNGEEHNTREDAIDANFQADINIAVERVLESAPSPISEIRIVHAKDLIQTFVNDNRDMVEVMLGNRDAT